MVLGHPLGAPHTTRLFISNAEIDEVAFGAKAFVGELTENDGHRGGEIEHVDRASPPDLAVDDLCSKRVVRPTVDIDRDDVGMAHQAQRRSVRIRSGDSSNHRVAAWTRRVGLDVDTGAFEVADQQV